MDPHLQHILLERLAADEALEEGAVDLILSACDGEGELAPALSAETTKRTVATEQLESRPRPPAPTSPRAGSRASAASGPATEVELGVGLA